NRCMEPSTCLTRSGAKKFKRSILNLIRYRLILIEILAAAPDVRWWLCPPSPHLELRASVIFVACNVSLRPSHRGNHHAVLRVGLFQQSLYPFVADFIQL